MFPWERTDQVAPLWFGAFLDVPMKQQLLPRRLIVMDILNAASPRSTKSAPGSPCLRIRW